jgi:AraC-like DNA-binding protein
MTPRDNPVTRRANRSNSADGLQESHDTREVRGMLRALGDLGFDLGALLSSAGLRRSDVENPDAYLPPAACAAVFAAAHAERRVDNLALQLALRTPVGATPLLDYLIVSSDSVGEGLSRLTRYLRLVNPAIRLDVRDGRDPVRVVVERTPNPFFTELTVSLLVIRFMRETDERFRAAGVSFSHEPDGVAEYARVFQCAIRARSSWNGVVISKSELTRPLRRRDPALRGWIERQAAGILARLPESGDVRDDVRSVLSTEATVGGMNIGAVSRRLSITPRTLQRRLARAGTTFEALCDDARRKAAETYLADTTLSIAEVTYLLGYSEPAAFHRAFKRWHGMTPHAFRMQT